MVNVGHGELDVKSHCSVKDVDFKGSLLFLNYTRYNFCHGKVIYSLFPFVVGLLLYFHSSCLWLMSLTGNLVLGWIPFVFFRCSLLTTYSVRFSMRRVSI